MKNALTVSCHLNINEMEKYASIYANMQLFTGNGMAVVQILENSQESNHGGVQV